MVLRKSVLGLGLTAFLALVTGLPAQAESLGDALVSAYESSGLLEQNRAVLRAADEDVAQATAALMPVVQWSANVTGAYGTTTNFFGQPVEFADWSAELTLQAQITLYDGGANRAAIEASKETVLGTRQRLIAVEQQVLLRAVQAYLNVAAASQFVSLRESNVRVLTQEFRAAQDRFDVGEVTLTDVSLSEARLAAARSQLAVEQGNLDRAIEEYAAAVGHRPNNLGTVDRAAIPASEAEAKAYAVRNHPSVREAQHSVSAAEFGVQRAKASTEPNVTLGTSLSLDEDFNDSGNIRLSVGGPVYQGGLLASVARQAEARRDATRAGLHLTVQGVEQNVGNAYANLNVARAGVEAYRRQIAAAQTAFDGVREEAKLGARTTLDVLNAEQELLDARANLVSAQANEVLATYAVMSAMGLLTAENLRLPVQQYDPTAYYNLVKDGPVATSRQGVALDRVLEALGKD